MFAKLGVRLRKRFEMFAALTMLFSQVVFPLAAATPVAAQSVPNDNITICHATSSSTNPYNAITVDPNSLNDGGGADHSSHSGDIIPAPYGTPTVIEQAILENGCLVPTVDICHSEFVLGVYSLVPNLPITSLMPGGFHTDHADDIIPAPYGSPSPVQQAILDNGCTIPPLTATINVYKSVVGGPAADSDFVLLVNNLPYTDGAQAVVPVANQGSVISLGEDLTTQPDYDFTNVICRPPGGGQPLNTGNSIYMTAFSEVDCTFTNTYDPEPEPIEGTIVGRKYDDANENGTYQAGDETRLDGWSIRLYNELWAGVEDQPTANNGRFEFTGLDAGVWYVCEGQQDGWVQSGPLLDAVNVNNSGVPSGGAVAVANGSSDTDAEGEICWQVTITENQPDVANIKFGNTDDLGNITVRKYDDRDASSNRQQNEPFLTGWEMRLYDGDWNLLDSGLTSNDTPLTFTDLPLGPYKVCEVMQPGWQQTNPSNSEGVVNQSGQSDEALRCLNSALDEAGETRVRNFGNFELGTLEVTKWEDLNLNGQRDDNDVAIADFMIRLYNSAWELVDTQMSPVATFADMPLGVYYACEVSQNGWTQSSPIEGDIGAADNISSQGDEEALCLEFEVTDSGQTLEGDFGNFEDGKIRVKKFHDLNGDGIWGQDEPQLADWAIRVYDDQGQLVNEKPSKEAGWVKFNVDQGDYLVCEAQVDGWVVTSPYIKDTESAPDDSSFLCVSVTIDESGERESVEFGNYQLSILQGRKYLDINQDGDHDRRGQGERRINDWVIRHYNHDWVLLNDSITGDDETNYGNVGRGQYRFAVQPGIYYTCEVLQDDWAQTGPNVGDTRNGAVAVANNSPLANQEGEVCWQADVTTAGERFTGLKFGNVDFATITVEKEVINDDGGLLDSTSFEYLINEESYSNWGEEIQVDVGNYSVGEEDPASLGYEITDIECNVERHDSNGDMMRLADVGNQYTLQAGDDMHCLITNDDMPAEITVTKYVRPVGNEQVFDFNVFQDEAEVDSFSLVGDSDLIMSSTDTLVPATTVMPEEQPSQHTTLVGAGNIIVTETPVDDWFNGIYVSCWLVEFHEYSNEYALMGGYYQYIEQVFSGFDVTEAVFDVDLGDQIHCEFYNALPGDVTVTKFHDVDQDGYFDQSDEEQETALSGWEINLHELTSDVIGQEAIDTQRDPIAPPIADTQTTNDEGQVVFEGLNPGRGLFRYAISENQQEGWNLSNMYCEYDDELIFDGSIDSLEFGRLDWMPVRVFADQNVDCFVGNYTDGDLELRKANDRPEPTENGDTVTYTLIVNVPDDAGCVFGSSNLLVSDAYGYYRVPHCDGDGPDRPEKEVVFSRTAGDDSEFEITSEPVTVTDLPPEGFTYVPGSWTAVSSERGDLKAAGITPEPTYASPGVWDLTNADSNFLVPGEAIVLTYQAVISAQPTDGTHPDNAFARAFDTGLEAIYANVSNVNAPFVGTEVTIATPDTPEDEGVVLGVATLADTGEASFTAPLVGSAIAAVALLPVMMDRKRGRRWLKQLTGLVKGTTAALLLAIMLLGVAAPTAAQAMTFEPWEVKMFEPDAPSAEGNFNLNYQVLSVEKGDSFTVNAWQDGSVIATQTVSTPFGDSGSFPIVLSEEGTFTFQVSATSTLDGATKLTQESDVTFDETAPAEPEFGQKTQAGSDYTVTFTVPAGSDATSVVIYGATTTAFTANASSELGSVAATPGEEQSFEFTAPSSDTYYFAVQSVDATGNRSAIAAEEQTVVSDDTQGAAAAGTDSTAGVDGDLPGDINGDGVVDDADIEGAQAEGDEGAVLSEEDSENGDDDSSSSLVWYVVGAGALAGMFYLYQGRQKPQE